MYELLDRAFLMSKGHVVFCGEPGAAYEHFEHAGGASPELASAFLPLHALAHFIPARILL